MKKLLFTMIFAGIAGIAGIASAAVIDFTGGTVHLANGTTAVTNNFGYWDNVDYYVEDGVVFDFVNGYGIVGDYYSIGAGGFVGNDVIHNHWDLPDYTLAMHVSMQDGSLFDLNYVDLTSNSIVGGGQADGSELAYIWSSTGYGMTLPVSDWGFATDFSGNPGDGVARLWLDNNFDNIGYFYFTAANAYCFGLDNFYINEPPPPVPEPSTFVLLGAGLAGLAAMRIRRRKG